VSAGDTSAAAAVTGVGPDHPVSAGADQPVSPGPVDEGSVETPRATIVTAATDVRARSTRDGFITVFLTVIGPLGAAKLM
jgi:hypothetical protein